MNGSSGVGPGRVASWSLLVQDQILAAAPSSLTWRGCLWFARRLYLYAPGTLHYMERLPLRVRVNGTYTSLLSIHILRCFYQHKCGRRAGGLHPPEKETEFGCALLRCAPQIGSLVQNSSRLVTMSTHAAISDMKCWAIAMLILAIVSGNLAIFITGIIGSSMVLCCASGNEQVARNASCFRGCAITCAVLGGLHALGTFALGILFVSITADCTNKLQGNSCNHLDGRRQLSTASHGPLRITALSTLVRHPPWLIGAATGGASLLVPTTSFGAALAKPSGAPALAFITGTTGARSLSEESDLNDDDPFTPDTYDYGSVCRDNDRDCCWDSPTEPFACESGATCDMSCACTCACACEGRYTIR